MRLSDGEEKVRERRSQKVHKVGRPQEAEITAAIEGADAPEAVEEKTMEKL